MNYHDWNLFRLYDIFSPALSSSISGMADGARKPEWALGCPTAAEPPTSLSWEPYGMRNEVKPSPDALHGLLPPIWPVTHESALGPVKTVRPRGLFAQPLQYLQTVAVLLSSSSCHGHGHASSGSGSAAVPGRLLAWVYQASLGFPVFVWPCTGYSDHHRCAAHRGWAAGGGGFPDPASVFVFVQNSNSNGDSCPTAWADHHC